MDEQRLYFSAMGGFFLDNIIGAIVKGIRRESRARTAAEWPIVDARIVSSAKSGVTYSYVVNGETLYGSCVGDSFRDIASRTAVEVLQVRYDPSDPAEGRVLNSDNPNLPFQIDHDPD
jgi:hypothetical protein